MRQTVAFIHTVNGLAPGFDALLAKQVAGVQTVHISDDTLIRSLLASGGVNGYVRERMAAHLSAAEAFGVDWIQCTCSSLTPCVDSLAAGCRAPVLSIDRAVAEEAVARYGRIGVIATNPATLGPSSALVRSLAADAGRAVLVESSLCDGAYAAYLAGDMPGHDRMVREKLLSLSGRVDAVLLAQASMARVADSLGAEELGVPLLSSPEPAMRRLGAMIRSREAGHEP